MWEPWIFLSLSAKERLPSTAKHELKLQSKNSRKETNKNANMHETLTIHILKPVDRNSLFTLIGINDTAEGKKKQEILIHRSIAWLKCWFGTLGQYNLMCYTCSTRNSTKLTLEKPKKKKKTTTEKNYRWIILYINKWTSICVGSLSCEFFDSKRLNLIECFFANRQQNQILKWKMGRKEIDKISIH